MIGPLLDTGTVVNETSVDTTAASTGQPHGVIATVDNKPLWRPDKSPALSGVFCG